ncbi:efflux transporter outer membrane subunit [Pseudomonas asplenii]|uniref:efflux transporter outer membrane subunit n=1 Tax=Pseudomonas asplenii TaxID=53407 RepID=UPI00235F348B|nr:efflux transporter outer membrane subunit [Pseudomonas asplenii]
MLTNTPLSKSTRRLAQRLCELLLALAVAGCSLAPDYERPVPAVPRRQGQSLVANPVEGAPASLSADEETLLAELAPDGQLRRQVVLALGSNRDFQLAGLRVLEARALYGVSDADRSPTLNAGLQRDRQHFDNAAADERYGQDLSVASLGVSDFELDFFGRVKNLSAAARHDYLATTLGQQAARRALLIEIVRAYLLEQQAGARQVAAQRICEARQALLRMAQEQQREGALSVDDLALTRGEALSAQRQLQAAIANHSRATQALALLGGYGPTWTAAPPVSDEALAMALSTPGWLVDMPSQRLLERFDVRQSEELLKAANANVGAARAAFFPTIRLSTGIGVASESLGHLLDAGRGAWLFSPQLTLPLFDGGRSLANLDLAEVRRQIAVVQYQKTVQAAFREVADVLTRRQQVLERLHSETDLRKLAQEQADRLSLVVAAGGAERGQLLTSRIRLAQADLAWRQSRYDVLLNRLDIYRVLSGTDAAAPPSHPDTGASS